MCLKLLATRRNMRAGLWNVKMLLQAGKSSQVRNEMDSYRPGILGTRKLDEHNDKLYLAGGKKLIPSREKTMTNIQRIRSSNDQESREVTYFLRRNKWKRRRSSLEGSQRVLRRWIRRSSLVLKFTKESTWKLFALKHKCSR